MDKSAIFRNASTTYYYSSIFFDGQVKIDVFSLYAYVRTVDDFIDTAEQDLKAFEQWWKETRSCWKTGQSEVKVIREFVELAKRKHFEWEWIEGFWKAMRLDLTKKTYTSFSELEEYIYGSAEVIGLMMARILDLPKAADHTARLQGKAMQLINFIRDVDEDMDLARVYIPQDTLRKFGVEPLRHGDWSTALRFEIERYRDIQAQAAKGYKYIPKKYLIPIKTAADMYMWTAEQIYKKPSIVWSRKLKPSKLHVMAQAVRNAITL